jgi:hypothetical protein
MLCATYCLSVFVSSWQIKFFEISLWAQNFKALFLTVSQNHFIFFRNEQPYSVFNE